MVPMKSFINRKVRRILLDIQAVTLERGGLCPCKSFTYKDRRVPNYREPLVQKVYLLRYLPAYQSEYYLMYRDLLDSGHARFPLRVLSIGCGCGIDFWGLCYAARDHGLAPREEIHYTGLDAVAWDYRDPCGFANVRFLTESAGSLRELDQDGYNVLTFAKSISEFSHDDVQTVCSALSSTGWASDRLCVCCSFMKEGQESDIRDCRKIVAALADSGFVCRD